MSVDETIERVAIAIRNEFGNRRGRGRDWEHLPDQVKENYRREAKAAIAAYEGQSNG